MDREVQVFRTFQLGELDDRPVYSPLMSAYPPIPQGFTWRGEITALQLTNNLKTLNSFTISLEDNNGSYYPLIQGLKILPSESNVDLLAVLFGGKNSLLQWELA